MRGLWSQMEESWRNTLVTRAEGFSLRNLSLLYGIPQPMGEIPEANWRGVLSALAYGRRGTFQDTYTAIKRCFDFLADSLVGNIIHEGGFVAVESNALDPLYLNRLIEIDNKVYFSRRFTAPTKMELVEVQTLYWEAAKPSSMPIAEDVPIKVLAFVVHERNPGRVITLSSSGQPNGTDLFTKGEECLFELILYKNQESLIPKTWLQNPDYGIPGAPPAVIDPGTITPPPYNAPYGGAALTSELDFGNPSGGGPHPLYAYSGEVYAQTERILSSTLAASVELRLFMNPPPL
jgi:hypothetical protein